MNSISKYGTGIRFGLITGLLYAVLLFLRYQFFSATPPSLFLFALLSYFFIILFMYLMTGIARKKELGGYADFKEIFQSIFITILITELFFVLFNIIYLKYINPHFLNNFKTGSLAYFQKLNLPEEQMKIKMEGVDSLVNMVKPTGLVKGYAASVILGSVFGLIFASILRKSKPAVEKIKEEPKL
jgi:hypothetical protein